MSSEAAHDLLVGASSQDDPGHALLLALARRVTKAPAADGLEAALRRTFGNWPADWPAADRPAFECLLASRLIAGADGPAAAARVYEALDLASRALVTQWSAGRIGEAAACQHLIARIRLTLSRCEDEAAHLRAAREAIAHALASRRRATDASLHAGDLLLLAEIEHAMAGHEPGTTALVRATSAAREALALRPPESGMRVAQVDWLARCLTELGTREASFGRLEEAVATARQSVEAEPSDRARETLARSLFALGSLSRRVDLLEEALSHAHQASSLEARVVEAEALEALGVIRIDAAPVRAAIGLWREIAGSANPRPEYRLSRCRATLLAARLTSDPGLLDEAIVLARELTSLPRFPSVAAALDRRRLELAEPPRRWSRKDSCEQPSWRFAADHRSDAIGRKGFRPSTFFAAERQPRWAQRSFPCAPAPS
jgi:tetratricopeptide (TPR) repeat protein